MSEVWRIRDWDKYYETYETRKLTRMTWVPVQNKHDGKGFRRIMRRDDALEILGSFLIILEVASRCPQRGLLEDQDGPLGSQEISDKTGAPSDVIEKALQVLASKEIGWIELVSSAGIPAEDPGIPADRPGNPGTNRTEWKGIEGNGREGTGMEKPSRPSKAGFEVDCDRFRAEYPREVSGWDIQILLSEIRAQADQDLMFTNLVLYRATDQWQKGMVPSAENWLKKGFWQVEPKEPVGAVGATGKKLSYLERKLRELDTTEVLAQKA